MSADRVRAWPWNRPQARGLLDAVLGGDFYLSSMIFHNAWILCLGRGFTYSIFLIFSKAVGPPFISNKLAISIRH